MSIQLRKVNAIGARGISVYQMPNSSKQTVFISKEEYLELGKAGAPQPPRPPSNEALWLYSFLTPFFDNSSGFQEVGDIWEKYPGRFQIKYDVGNRRISLDSTQETILGISPNITVTKETDKISIVITNGRLVVGMK